MGAVCHHDAITGTSRKLVVENYLQRLDRARNNTASVADDMMSLLLTKEVRVWCTALTSLWRCVSDSRRVQGGDAMDLTFPRSVLALPEYYPVVDAPVLVANSLAWSLQQPVSVTIRLVMKGKAQAKRYRIPYAKVVDAQGAVVEAQIHAAVPVDSE